MIYFDNAASAKPHPRAVEAFNAAAENNYANPAALHSAGIKAEKILSEAREKLLSLLPKGGSLIFTSGATESNNLAILYSVKGRDKSRIVTTPFEHPSVGSLIEDKSGAISDDTALFSQIAVCGETGFIHNIPDCPPDCLLHVDAAQAFGKIPLTSLKADLISVSAHKIGGLSGVGGLWVRKGVRIKPMLFGGGQQGGIRPGTEPVALIAAFAASIDNGQLTVDSCHGRLVAGLRELKLPVHSRNSIANIVNFSCFVKSEIMLHFLAEHDIFVSSGSACARGKKSVILPKYGVSDRDVDTAIRVSFGWQNTLNEVDTFLEVLEAGIKRWRK
ncbi:MAG: aminotransferase class V-fold PLP-dependent enzyme [Oscillospiraceae bacterium]|nr:aminotransferase class V-fold PLP-dependent enzyme [Oscillospiraceae bacterium]